MESRRKNGSVRDEKSPENVMFSAPSRKCGNGSVKRWDPSFSSLQKAVGVACPSVTTTGKTAAQLLSECPSITTDSNGNYAGGNYFEIVSENYLGTKQHYQLQPSNVYGTVEENGQQVTYHWGSKCTAVGTCDSSVSPTITGSLTEIPRGYHESNNFGALYNLYAATAETARSSGYNMTKDSLCPKGWNLAEAGSAENDKTWRGLLVGHYGFNDNSSAQSSNTRMLYEHIFAFVLSNFYGIDGTRRQIASNASHTSIWVSSEAAGASVNAGNFGVQGGRVYFSGISNKGSGLAIRCVRSDD